MKTGFRSPSVSRSIKARTTGKLTRSIKRNINPLYGKKGTGYINNPKKAIYNQIYNKTTMPVIKYSSKSTKDLAALTLPELKNILRESGMKVSGNKQELINRIQTASVITPNSYDTYITDDDTEIYAESQKKFGLGIMGIAAIYSIFIPLIGILLWIIGLHGLGIFTFVIYAVILIISYSIGKNA